MTRILVADDHKLFGQTLRAWLEGYPDLEVVAEAENGRAAVRLARELTPDIVLMDIALPGLNGIEATRKIVAAQPSVKVIALSAHGDPHVVDAMRRAGAMAYVLKEDAGTELLGVIHAVATGQTSWRSPLREGNG